MGEDPFPEFRSSYDPPLQATLPMQKEWNSVRDRLLQELSIITWLQFQLAAFTIVVDRNK